MTDLDHTADGLRECAIDLRLLADRLRRAGGAVPWEGRSATAVRQACVGRAASLEDAAHACETAARAVGGVAAGVDRLEDAATTVVEAVAEGAEEVAGWLDRTTST